MTYALPQLLPFEVDFEGFLLSVETQVRSMRRARSIKSLVPDALLIGQESTSRQVAPPSCCIVPTGFRYHSARLPDRDTVGYTPIEPKPVWSQWMQLDVICWGDDDPEKLSRTYSFSSATEIAREVLVSLADNNYGPASVRVNSAEWVQETHQQRNGRKLLVRVEVETFVVRDPPALVPIATPTTPGVQADVTMYLQTADTLSTETEVVFLVPPGVSG